MSGRRAGPFAWSVIIELAQAGALAPDDRVWRMGLPSWSRAGELPDLVSLIHEPAPSRRRAESRVHPLWLAAAVMVIALTVFFYVVRDGLNPSAGSLAAFAPQATAFEARYPFLTELRRVDPPRFEQLDRVVRLAFRRSVSTNELNAYVADAAREIERTRLGDVGDSGALRFALALRAAARTFRSSDPAQCAAILGPHSAATPVRSAAALSAIAPALTSLLDAPVTPHAAANADLTTQTLADVGSDADVDPKVACDRLLLMYDGAVAQTPDAGAAFVRAMLGR
ncbi:MAG: DUF4339 domain-containing protein [Gammaproteobacteria bacterium]|nr:DUF4339 domain-containing protein [Gammaproteobacteria bacterium]